MENTNPMISSIEINNERNILFIGTLEIDC